MFTRFEGSYTFLHARWLRNTRGAATNDASPRRIRSIPLNSTTARVIIMTASDLEVREEPSRAAVLAKADDTDFSKVSEVKVFAIPLFHQDDLVQLVYLPIAAQERPGEPSKSYVPQKLRGYATKAQASQVDTLMSRTAHTHLRSTRGRLLVNFTSFWS